MADNVIFLSNVRLSFPHIKEPQTKDRVKPSYNAEFILSHTDPGWAQFHKVVAELAAAKWGEHANNVLNLINQDKKKRCYGSGAEKINQKTFKPYDGYEGMMYITAGRDTRPQLIDLDRNTIDPSNTLAVMDYAGKLYGGCYVNAAVKPWLQDNQHGRAVRCDFVAIQFNKDGQAFGEGAFDASGMFGAVAAPAAGVPTPAGMGFGAAPAPAPQMPAAPFGGQAPGLPSFLQ